MAAASMNKAKKAIIVTGTPGTGKTTFAKRLAKEKGLKYIDVNQVVSDNDLSEGYDRSRRCKIIDESKLAKVLEKMIEDSGKVSKEKKEKGKPKIIKTLIIDSHMSHSINPEFVKICIVTKCAIPQLEKRLKKKRYHKAKIAENIEAENMDICLHEAEERGHAVKIEDTSKKH